MNHALIFRLNATHLLRDESSTHPKERWSRFLRLADCTIGIAVRPEPTPQVSTGAPDGEGARTHHESCRSVMTLRH